MVSISTVVLLGSAVLAGVAGAAPMDLPAQPEPRSVVTQDGVAGSSDREALSGVPSTSRTIDLLLEMQGKNPGLAAGERQSREVPDPEKLRALRQAAGGKPLGADATALESRAPGGTGPAGVPADVPGWTGGPAGGSAAIGFTAAPGIEATPGSRSAAAMTGLAADPPRGARDDGQSRWLIPPGFIQFLRDHRYYVFGASVVVLIALGWGGARSTRGKRR